MRPKIRGVKQFALGGLAALALSSGAPAAPLFVTYGLGTNVTSLEQTSDAIDLGGVFSSFTIDSTLGLALISPTPATLSTSSEGLQVVQGCALAAGSCGPSDWFDISGKGLSLGGANFTQSSLPFEVHSFDTGSLLVTGVSVESLRLKFDADTISPTASIAPTGSLSVDLLLGGPGQGVPEPPTWALLVASIMSSIGASARRRIG